MRNVGNSDKDTQRSMKKQKHSSCANCERRITVMTTTLGDDSCAHCTLGAKPAGHTSRLQQQQRLAPAPVLVPHSERRSPSGHRTQNLRMVNPELDPGDSEVPADMRPSHHLTSKSSEYPTGKIRIEELLDTLTCIQCNAGLVVGIFAGLMMMIRHKEEDIRMSRVPSQTVLNMMMTEAAMAFVSGFLFMGALGLFRKLWSDKFNYLLRKPSLIAATILTLVSLVVHFLGAFVWSGSGPVDQAATVTLFTMCCVICLFDLGIVGIALKVMIYNNFGEGFSEDSSSPRFHSTKQDDHTIPGIQ